MFLVQSVQYFCCPVRLRLLVWSDGAKRVDVDMLTKFKRLRVRTKVRSQKNESQKSEPKQKGYLLFVI